MEAGVAGTYQVSGEVTWRKYSEFTETEHASDSHYMYVDIRVKKTPW